MSTKKLKKYTTKDLEKKIGPLTFANVILSCRECEGLSQTEMATLLGISKQSLCDLEKGRRIPSARRAASIAEILELMPETFIELALQDQLTEASLDYQVHISKKKCSR